MSKLEYYGITGKENDLLRSYLTGRSQYVEVNGHKSSHLQISTRIPQGSVLDPLLFLIYINVLPNASNIFDMLMYADDTTLFCNMTDTMLLLFASSSDFFPSINPVVPGLGRRTPRSCLLASSTV